MTITATSTKEEMINDIKNKIALKIFEPETGKFIIDLLNKATTLNEAFNIYQLGTNYTKTGLHYEVKKEKMSDTINYLRINKDLSFTSSNSELSHELIIGDNYPALQNLLIKYKGLVNIIYIDPPYGKDSMGQFANTNYVNSLTRDNLLSRLFPRLKLAKQLLSDDGVIFVSIDDRNQAYIKCLMDDIFEERNFIAMPMRRKNKLVMKGDGTFKNVLEPLLIYAKNKKNVTFLHTKEDTSDSDFSMISTGYGMKEVFFKPGSFNFVVKDGVIAKGNYSNLDLMNDIEIENYKNVNVFSIKAEFKWSQQKIDEKLNSNAYILVKNIKSMSPRIHFIANTSKPLDYIDDKYGKVTNEDGKADLNKILGEGMFDYPKPVDFIKFLLNIYNNNHAIVLDFFAGSGTTGQAVLEMNKDDDGCRKFILTQLDENLDISLEASQGSKRVSEILRNQIALCDLIKRPHLLSEITVERLRRIMTGSSICSYVNYKSSPLGDSLCVFEVAKVSNKEFAKEKSAFEVIDETLYVLEKFKTVKDKVEWIVNNFENTQIKLED